jgi:hypothetical protein
VRQNDPIFVPRSGRFFHGSDIGQRVKRAMLARARRSCVHGRVAKSWGVARMRCVSKCAVRRHGSFRELRSCAAGLHTAMTHRLLYFGVLAAVAAAGCASTVQAEPEPEAPPPPLRIEDQSANAPPPPPPSAPPNDAQAPTVPPPTAAPTAPPPTAAPTAPPPTAAPPSLPPSATPSTAPTGASQPPPPGAAPDASWTQEYPTGRWVYANGYGWMWVPANTATADSEGVPYAYLYTPTYGWTWYLSPWGPGPYRYGVWVRRPWQPVGWRGAWVARPGVVIRLGGPGPRYYHYRDRGPRHRR